MPRARWLITGNWILNDVVAVSLCVLAISFLRLPSLRVASLLLFCLFLYDIFWVFYSANFFGDNVMVTVAVKEAVNPTALVTETLNLPLQVVPTIQLPTKLIWGDMILGNGDIVMPGLLVAFAARFDRHKATIMGKMTPSSLNAIQSSTPGYFLLALIGYSIGLVVSMVMAFTFNSPQPALLYLVPCTFFPFGVVGLKRRELGELWRGPPSPFAVTSSTSSPSSEFAPSTVTKEDVILSANLHHKD